jgi:hypothetical protein
MKADEEEVKTTSPRLLRIMAGTAARVRMTGATVWTLIMDN